MRKLFSGILVWASVVCCLCSPIGATSYIPPRTLADLALGSDAVVLARAVESEGIQRGALIFTDTEFLVQESLSGPVLAGGMIRVQVPGGEAGDKICLVPGAPRFQAGELYLLHLHRKSGNLWIPTILSYGTLKEVEGRKGIPLLVQLEEFAEATAIPRPDGASAEDPVPFYADALIDHLNDVLKGRAVWNIEAVRADADEVPLRSMQDRIPGGGAVPGNCTYFNSGGSNWRWRTFDSNGTATIYANATGDPSEPTGGFQRIQEGLDLWMDITGTSLNLLFGGARDITPNCGGQGGFILFDDPCSDIADLSGCGGTLAFGGSVSGGTHTFDGTTWITVTDWFVVMNNGVGCLGTRGYRILLAHELGHGIGFNHSPDSSSLMWGTCCRDINSTDITCARYTYPATSGSNARPQVDAGGDRNLLLVGNSTLLRGAVADDGLPAPGRMTTTWISLAGPGRVTFENPSSLETVVTFSRSGTYLLGLLAHDGELLRMDQAQVTVDIYAGSQPPVTFQQGINGYRGTVDTVLLESAPEAIRSGTSQLSVDGDDPGGSGLTTQVLLRFENIFGAEPGQIIPGVPVRSARLELSTVDPGTGASLYRMLDPWSDRDSWSTFGNDGVQADQEALSQADATSPGTDGIVSIDVTASLDDWSRNPCSNNGWAFLPIGDDGWDFYSAEGVDPPRLIVEPAEFRRELLIQVGDTWSYFKGTQEPPADWREIEFEAGAGWLSGPTGIGYGDGDDATILGDMRNRYRSIFCRHEFTASGPISQLTLRIDYDDGFVAYLNREEVARSANMGTPGTPVNWNALASPSREAGVFEEYQLPAENLFPGKNVLAVEVHNAGSNSSDLSFIPELSADYLVIPDGSLWKYHRGSSPPPSDWNQPGIDDSSWESGRTGIGYGDGDDLTELLDMEGSYLSIFCRKTFTVFQPGTVGELLFTMIYDDGVVVYLNGEEIDRVNMPAGPVTRTTPAASSIEPQAVTLTLPGHLLQAGENVLAVSVHNQSIDSSDLSFNPILAPRPQARSVFCGSGFQRGDASNDGLVDISDAIALLFHLFAAGGELDCPDAADIDDNGALDVTDTIYLLRFLFLNGESPPLPGIECGEDSTPDGLGDCSTLGCGGF